MMSQKVMAKKTYEKEVVNGKAIVRFSPEGNRGGALKASTVPKGVKALFYFSLFGGWLPGYIVGAETTWDFISTWLFVLFLAVVTYLFAAKASLKDMDGLDKLTFTNSELHGLDGIFDKEDIRKVQITHPDTHFTYKASSNLSYEFNKKNMEQRTKNEHGIVIEYGVEEFDVVTNALSLPQAEDISKLIYTWLKNPDEVLSTEA